MWRLADGAEQVPFVEWGDARPSALEIRRRHDDGGLRGTAQKADVHSVVDTRRVRDADQHRVRGFLRPARQVGGAEVGGVKLGTGDLDDAVDAACAADGRVPAPASGQRLPRYEIGDLRRT